MATGEPLVIGNDDGISFATDSSDGWEGDGSSSSGGEYAGGLDVPRDCTQMWVEHRVRFATPRAVPYVNSSTFEGDPRLSEDGLVLYFTSARPGGLGEHDIWYITRETRRSDFKTFPENLTIVNSRHMESGFMPWPNGRGAYFSTDREAWRTGGAQIYQVLRTEVFGVYGVAAPLPGVNALNEDNYDPLLSPDGKRLYWTALRAEESGNMRIAKRADPEEPSFEAVEPLSFRTASKEDNPALSKDERVLVFGSAHGESHDLYYVVRESLDAPFSEPRIVPDVNASEYNDGEAFLTGDACELYFASEARPNGSGSWDIYHSSVVGEP